MLLRMTLLKPYWMNLCTFTICLSSSVWTPKRNSIQSTQGQVIVLVADSVSVVSSRLLCVRALFCFLLFVFLFFLYHFGVRYQWWCASFLVSDFFSRLLHGMYISIIHFVHLLSVRWCAHIRKCTPQHYHKQKIH